jgi:hypothetical protein
MKHLKENNLSYFQHTRQALGYFAKIQLAAICVFIHAWWPSLFESTASEVIIKLADHFKQKRYTK